MNKKYTINKSTFIHFAITSICGMCIGYLNPYIGILVSGYLTGAEHGRGTNQEQAKFAKAIKSDLHDPRVQREYWNPFSYTGTGQTSDFIAALLGFCCVCWLYWDAITII